MGHNCSPSLIVFPDHGGCKRTQAMELQAEAERRKRASILESEGQRQAKINVAEAQKQSVILASEATKEEAINRATGEAEAIFRKAEATSRGLNAVAASLQAGGGSDAAALRVAEKYVEAFSQIAREGTTMLLPASTNDPAAMVAQAMGIYKQQTSTKPSSKAAKGSGNSVPSMDKQYSSVSDGIGSTIEAQDTQRQQQRRGVFSLSKEE